MKFLYWLFVGWWIVPTIWFIKILFKIATKYIPNIFNEIANLIHQAIPNLGEGQKGIARAKLILGGFIILIIIQCCVCNYLYSLTPTGKTQATELSLTNIAKTVQISIDLTTTAAYTPFPTPIPATDTLQPTETPTLPPATEIPSQIPIILIDTPIPVAPTNTYIPAPTNQICYIYCGSDSQPCGDSCISLNYTCHKAPGRACP